MKYKGFLDDALDIAKSAGDYLEKMYYTDFNISSKGSKDLVTDADYGSEKIILNMIKERYPEHSILSEEAGEEINNSNYKWIVDPLDGTVNFSRKIPIFGVIIALVENGVTVLGVHYLPMLKETYSAVKGEGAYLNGKKIKVSETEDIQEYIMGLGDFNIGKDKYMKDQDNEILENIIKTMSPKTMRTKIFGAACMDLACIASGRTDLLFYPFTNPWDVLAGSLIIEEAGGKVFSSDKLTIFSNGKNPDYFNNMIYI